MQTWRATIVPLAAFGTPLKGDTFFGQLCWAVRNRFGAERLVKLLDGYTAGRPFAVVSDALPSRHLPRPALPGHLFREVPEVDRKALKKRVWMPVDSFDAPLQTWLAHCRSAAELPAGAVAEHPQPHNTINRATGTTGKGSFAPYAMPQLWHGKKVVSPREIPQMPRLDLYVVLDDARIEADELKVLIEDVGAIGFGRDASIGLGKFRLDDFMAFQAPEHSQANAWLTLAPSAPQGLDWDDSRSFYNVFTRFGRHGDIAVHTGKPFKTPVLLAQTGAVLAPRRYDSRPFTGRGLGGDGSLSKSISETVHQGYAPVLGVRLPESDKPQ